MSKKIEMADIVRALEKVRGAPVLTSNQCWDLTQALNAAAPVVERQCEHPEGCTSCSWCGFKASLHAPVAVLDKLNAIADQLEPDYSGLAYDLREVIKALNQ